MSETIEEGRGSGLFAGTMSPEELQTETGWTYRTRQRREAEGMPVLKVGNVKRYPIPEVRAWILSHVRQRNMAPPRAVGRPRTAAPTAPARTDNQARKPVHAARERPETART
jgi:hypothetical protein